MNNVFAYIRDDDKRKQIISLCKSTGLTYANLTMSDLNKEIGFIIGQALPVSFLTHKTVPFGFVMPEVIIFNGVKDSLLDDFLSEYKNRNIAPIPMKAIVTPVNTTWSLYELIIQLEEEIKNR